MNTLDNKTLIRRYIREIYLDQNLQSLDELVDPECGVTIEGANAQKLDDLKTYHADRQRDQQSQYKVCNFYINSIKNDGELIVVRLKQHAEYPPDNQTDEEKKHECIVFKKLTFHVENGKIANIKEKTEVSVDIYSPRIDA